jgi:hypothetical protein
MLLIILIKGISIEQAGVEDSIELTQESKINLKPLRSYQLGISIDLGKNQVHIYIYIYLYLF